VTQLPLSAPWARAKYLRILDDYGPVGDGASGAHTALAENLDDYLLKGPAYAKDHPQVAGNEIVAAELADLLGLPILDHTIAQLDDDLFFASSYMPKGSWFPNTTAELLETCANRDRVYDLVVFDIWICNVDRHSGNLLVRVKRLRNSKEEVRTLILNDHSHTLVLPGNKATELQTLVESPAERYLQLGFVRDEITDSDRLGDAIGAVERVSDYDIEHIVASIPEPLLANGDRAHYISLLEKRRDAVRQLIDRSPDLLPALGGSA
jgi:hypothetical protein